jgi:putative ABC transport system permease protein
MHARELREHPWRTAIAVVMVAVSSALVVAVLGLITSVDASADNLSAEVAGSADVEVAATFSGATLDDAVVADVEQADGVTAAAPIVESAVELDSERAVLLGGDARALAFLPDDLAATFGEQDPGAVVGDVAQGGVVLSFGLAEALGVEHGDVVPVSSPAETRNLAVAAVLPRQATSVNLVLSDLAGAVDLRGGDGYDRVLVELEPDVSGTSLDETLDGRAVVLDPQVRVDDVNAALAPLVRTLTMLAGLGVTVAGVLVFNIVSLSVSERRRHLAVAQALGARRRRLWRALIAEAALLGVVGGVVGALGGRIITAVLIDQLPPGVVNSVFPTALTPDVPVLVLLAGTAVGVLAATGAAAGAAVAVARLSPLEAMGPRDVVGEASAPIKHRGLVLGLGCVLTGTLLLVVGSPETQSFAALLVLNGIVVLVWALRAPLATVTGAVTRRARAPGLLASLAIERSPARNAMTTLAALLPVAVVVGLGGLTVNIYDTAERDFSTLGDGDLYLTGRPFSEVNDDRLLPPEVTDEVAAIDGVSDIGRARFTFLRVAGGEALAYGGEPGIHTPALELASSEAAARVFSSDAAVVSKSFANRLDLSTGDTFPITTAQGDVDVTIADVVDVMTWPGGFVFVSYEHLVEWSGLSLPSVVEVELADGAAKGDVSSAAGAIGEQVGVDVYVTDGEDAVDEALIAVEQSQNLFSALQAVLMAAGAFAIVSTLTISTISRTRELGLLQAVGARRQLVRRAVVTEAFAVTLTGALLGATVGVALQYIAVLLLGDATGFPADFSFTVQPLLVALGASLAIAAVAAFFTVRRVVSLDVLDAVAYE